MTQCGWVRTCDEQHCAEECRYNNTDGMPLRCASLSQVFGSFVVCKDRSVLEAVAASGVPVDGITLEGDVMRRKGTISGGFVNTARSKILTHKRVRHLCLYAACVGAFELLVYLCQHRRFLRMRVACRLLLP
jgi:hypothetical protein